MDSEQAAEILLGGGFRHLPAVAASGLVGIVSLRDLLSVRVRRGSHGRHPEGVSIRVAGTPAAQPNAGTDRVV